MGYNSVVSDHLKSTGIPWVDGLSTGPLDLGCHTIFQHPNHFYVAFNVLGLELILD